MAATSKTSRAKEALLDYLHSRGMRLTSERLAILEVIAKLSGLFSVEDLHTVMAREAFPVAIATLYNTIEVLVDAGIVKCLRLPDRHTALYRLDMGTTPHIYMVCEQCGAIKEASGKSLARQFELWERGGFHTRTFMLCVYGLCKKCAKKSLS